MNNMCGIDVISPLQGWRFVWMSTQGCVPRSLHSTLGYCISPRWGWANWFTRSLIMIAAIGIVFGSLSPAFCQNKKKSSPAPQSKTTTALDEEEYSVYSALIQSLYTGGAKVVVIDNFVSGCVPVGNNAEGEKSWQQSLDKLPAKLPTLSTKTIADFKSKSRVCRSIDAKLTLPTKYILLSQAERRAIFSKADVNKSWQSFQQKYPGANGYINVSNIGFNEDRTQALVDTFRKCGEKCGGEKMVVLTKVNGKWSVTATHKIWEL
jgi:hypothetical protein